MGIDGQTGGADRLLDHLDQLHTTELGALRIRRNLALEGNVDVVAWCRGRIGAPASTVTRQGKNWYITAGRCRITVNAHSYTIITAHTLKTE